MHIDFVDNISIDKENDLTITQQYHIVTDWYIGYNSSWEIHPFCNRHCLFIDLDMRIDNGKLFLSKLLNAIEKHHNEPFLLVMLRTNPNHYHVVSPQLFTWFECQSIWHSLAMKKKSYNLRNWVVQNTMRGYATLRLSKKGSKAITPIHIDHNLRTYRPETSKLVWEILKAFGSHNPDYLLDMISFEDRIKLVTTEQTFQPYGGHD